MQGLAYWPIGHVHRLVTVICSLVSEAALEAREDPLESRARTQVILRLVPAQ